MGVLKVTDENSRDPEPDPLAKGTYPRIRIRTKMLGIRNTGLHRTAPVGRLSEAGALALTAEEGEMVVVQLVVDAVLHNVLK